MSLSVQSPVRAVERGHGGWSTTQTALKQLQTTIISPVTKSHMLSNFVLHLYKNISHIFGFIFVVCFDLFYCFILLFYFQPKGKNRIFRKKIKVSVSSLISLMSPFFFQQADRLAVALPNHSVLSQMWQSLESSWSRSWFASGLSLHHCPCSGSSYYRQFL